MKYQIVVCGGTFDLFHKGHEDFLQFVLSTSKRVVIGITGDTYVRAHKENVLESFEQRKKSVEAFIKDKNRGKDVTVVEIDDIFGPNLDPNFHPDAIIVTEQSKNGALEINRERVKKGLKELSILTHPLLEINGLIISSSLVRRGVINRVGRTYENKQWLKTTLLLPEVLRKELRSPFGEIVDKIPVDISISKTVTVGDVVTKIFTDQNKQPKICIIDLLIERKKVYQDLSVYNFGNSPVRKVKNPPATLCPQLFEKIRDAFSSSQTVIQVDGEEDLAVLPVLIYAPLGFSIFYGQPGSGMVWINVTEETKEHAYSVLSQFETI